MPSEDTLVLLAIDRNHTNLDDVIDAVEVFFSNKAALDNTDRFNLVFFLEKGPVYVEDFTFKWDFLVNLLRQYKDQIGTPNFEGGLFIALTFILDIFKQVSGKYFRILAIKDRSIPPMTKDFLVNGLLEKVRDMPVFLDVIDLGMAEDPDEEKVRAMIETSRGGDLYFAPDMNALKAILEKQSTTKKEIKVGLWDEKPDYKMSYENKEFFEDLAAKLVPVDDVKGKKCTVCFQQSSPVCGTDALVACPSCNTAFHDCCLVNWAEQSNIGIEHVFRCPICFYLITLPEFLVMDILNGNTEEYTSFESFLEEVDQDALLMEKDTARELNLVLKELEF